LIFAVILYIFSDFLKMKAVEYGQARWAKLVFITNLTLKVKRDYTVWN